MHWSAVALVGGVAVLSAQNVDPREIRVSSAPYLPKAATTIKAETRLVEVGVVVRDSRGRPVSGLGKSDFEVWDNGKRHEVTAFSVQSFVAEAPNAAVPSPATGATAPLPAVPVKSRFVGIVFDDISTPAAELFHAKAAAMSFLKSGLAANDRVAILTISSGLVLPFTADKTALSGAIDKVVWRERKLDSVGCPLLKPYDSYLIANHLDQTALDVKAGELMVCQPGICGMSGGNRRGGGATTACAAAVRQVQAMANALWEEVRTQSLGIIRTLQNIVDLMARMNGARMVLLTSSGFLSGTLEADQDQIIDRALRANVVINSLDAKGLYTEDAPAMGMGAGVRSVIYAQSQGTRPKEESNEAMGNLADSTGGLFFHNSNDLDLGFRDLGMQPETSYLLGYSPDAPDGRYHRLKVSLTSKSHDNVQARKGYMAVVRPAEKPAPERRIDREVFGGSQWNDVPVTVAAEPAKLENGNPVARMAFVWDLAKMRFHLQDGIRSEKLHMVAALLDEQGNFVTGKEGVVEFALSESTFNRAVSAGFSISMSLEAPAGAYRLRTVVVEDGDEHASAATQAVVLK